VALTPRQTATDRAELGRQVADAVHNAIAAELPLDFQLLTVLAHRIEQCNSNSNIWVARDLHTTTGEAYDGHGRFWCCGSKLCPSCLARSSRHARKLITLAIQNQKLLVGEHYHFLTLTMPNYGLPLLEARQLMHYAWTLFRKKKWFRDRVLGGCRSEEFTLTKTGYHYHQHLIVRSKYLEYHSFRHQWTECLRTAFARAGKSLSFATSDHMAIANCQRVGSITEAVKEVAKYITKATSWKRLASSDLLDAARIERWPRMFELFGSFRTALSGVAVPEVDEASDKTILDTKSLSDGDSGRGWREQFRTLGVVGYLDKLHEDIATESEFRMLQLKHKYSAAVFWRLRCKDRPQILSTTERIQSLASRKMDPQTYAYQYGETVH
jgi:hypothetical protein